MRKISQMPLRLPQSLHQELKHEAQEEGLSLNQYCLYVLARHHNTTPLALKHRAENLLHFLAQAQALQKQLNHQKLKTISTRKPPKESPLSRYQKIYGKN